MRPRFEYEFVTVPSRRDTATERIRETVRERAAAGWRLVQVVPPLPGPRWRRPGPLEVVFERPLPGQWDEEDDLSAAPI